MFGWRWVRLTFSTIAYFSYLRSVPFLFRSFCPSCQLVVVLFSWVLCKCRSRVRAAHGVLASTSNSLEETPEFRRVAVGDFFSFLFSFFPFSFARSKGGRKVGVSFSPSSDRFAFVEAPAGLRRTCLCVCWFFTDYFGKRVRRRVLSWLKKTPTVLSDGRWKNWEASTWSVCYEICTSA